MSCQFNLHYLFIHYFFPLHQEENEEECQPTTLSPVAEEDESLEGRPSPTISPESSHTPLKPSHDTHQPGTGVEETKEKEVGRDTFIMMHL